MMLNQDLHADEAWDKNYSLHEVQITRKSNSEDMKRVLISTIDLGLRDQIIINRIIFSQTGIFAGKTANYALNTCINGKTFCSGFKLF